MLEYKKVGERKFFVTVDGKFYLIVTYPFKIYSLDTQDEYSAIEAIRDFEVPPVDFEAYKKLVNTYFCLELLPSTRCNLACTGCIAQNPTDVDGGLYRVETCQDMTEDTMFNHIMKAVDLLEERIVNNEMSGDEVSLHFFITGGEPFINGDNLLNALLRGKKAFEEMAVRYSKSSYFNVQIVTNGILIREDQIPKIKELNALITISFDTPYNENKIDRLGNSHREEQIRNFHMLIDNGHKRVSANLCVSADYVDDLDRIMDYLDQRGIVAKASSIQMSPMSPPIHASENFVEKNKNTKISSFKTLPHTAEKFSQKLIDFSEKYGIDMKLYKRRMTALIQQGGLLLRCCILNNKWCIMPSGDIYTCHMLGGIEDFKVGHISDPDWRKSEKYKELSERFYNRLTYNLTPCKDCVLQTICINFIDCPARDLLENGDLDIVGDHQCQCAKSYLLYILEKLIKEEYGDD